MCHNHTEAKMLGFDLTEQSWSCRDMLRHALRQPYVADLAKAWGLCSFFDVAAGMVQQTLS